MTSATAQRTYDGLPEFYREVDPDNGSALHAFVEALVDGMGVGDVDEVLQTFPDRLLAEQDTVPIAWIRWLSQHLGVQFNPTYSEAQQRAAVKTATSGWRSGTIPALEDAVREGIRPHHADGTYVDTMAGGSYSTPVDAPLQVTGDIDVRVRSDAHYGADEDLLDVLDTNSGFALRNKSANGTVAAVIGDGTTLHEATSSAVVPFGQYDVGWTRFVAKDSGADKVVDFYTADDASVIFWEALGTQQTLVGAAGSIDYTGVVDALIGQAPGHYFEVEVRAGEDGPVVARFDATGEAVGTSPVITDPDTGHVWSPAGAAEVDQYPDEPYVDITRHYGGDIWTLGVTTAEPESPSDTAVIAAAIEEAQSRPAGFKIVFIDFVTDWATIETSLPTWADWEAAGSWSDIQSTA